jgi:hypothetical protein
MPNCASALRCVPAYALSAAFLLCMEACDRRIDTPAGHPSLRQRAHVGLPTRCPLGHGPLVHIPIEYGTSEGTPPMRADGILPQWVDGGCVLTMGAPTQTVGCVKCGAYAILQRDSTVVGWHTNTLGWVRGPPVTSD